MEFIGTIGVDAGTILVGDACYWVGKNATSGYNDKDWNDDGGFCIDLLDNEKAGVWQIRNGLGITFSADDGEYSVYRADVNGRRGIFIELEGSPEEEEEEENYEPKFCVTCDTDISEYLEGDQCMACEDEERATDGEDS